MKPESLENHIKNVYDDTLSGNFARRLDKRVLDNMYEVLKQNKQKPTASPPSNIWRIIMKNQSVKIAAAVLLIAVAITGYVIFDNESSMVYAMEQTIQANHTVRNLHIRVLSPAMDNNPNNPSDVWLQFDDTGQLLNARAIIPKSPDGPKVVIWRQDVLRVWLKQKNLVVAIRDNGMAEQVVGMITFLDPKLTFQRIYEARTKDEMDPEITMPQKDGDSIIIKITDSGRKERLVLYVNPQTKLLERFDRFIQKGNDYIAAESFEFLEYNQPIDPKMFEFHDLPEGTVFVDHVNNPVGLPQGDLPDDAIAMKVARTFFEALIARDFEEVGLVYSGLPAERAKEIFHDMKVVKIVSINEPIPYPDPRVGGVLVPCHVVIEKDGRDKDSTLNLAIRPVENQPDRWNIHGMSQAQPKN